MIVVEVRVIGGGGGHATAFAGEVLTLAISEPQATGRPVEVTLALADGELCLRGKSRGSRRREDGRFDVSLRLVALRREERLRLTAVFAPA